MNQLTAMKKKLETDSETPSGDLRLYFTRELKIDPVFVDIYLRNRAGIYARHQEYLERFGQTRLFIK